MIDNVSLQSKIDIYDCETGEIYFENLFLAEAFIKAAEMKSKVIELDKNNGLAVMPAWRKQ